MTVFVRNRLSFSGHAGRHTLILRIAFGGLFRVLILAEHNAHLGTAESDCDQDKHDQNICAKAT